MDKDKIVSVFNRLNHKCPFNNDYTLLDFAFSLTPPCVKNFFIRSYVHNFRREPSDDELYKKMWEALDEVDVRGYVHISEVYVNMNTTFHPYANKTLLTQFNRASRVFLNKLLDDNDDYFNQNHEGKLIDKKTISEIIIKDREIIDTILSYGGAIGGSIALAHYGEVYRKEVHDIDFVLPLDCLSEELINLIEDTSKITVMNKEKRDKEKAVPELFMQTSLYKNLDASTDEEVKIKDFNIDQISDYDKVARGVIILTIGNKDYDLIFRNTVNATIFVDEFTNYGYRCQSLEDSLATKRLLARPKDFQDLINFKRYEGYTH